ncbi:MAG: hypothetical protein LBN26_02305 [Christensenellaceae bacterium]|jgi:hypothetical protein|nr:hypothetical protein [Christensenellaceae bacterium]
MHMRPSVVHIRKRCYRRRTLHFTVVLVLLLLLMLLCKVGFIWSLILSGILTLLFWVFLYRR